ncbi:hypothetical protein JKF63_05111 [Porcisia hertigi]|uniref:Flagellar attachment zone protein 1 conserved domain-containing protein n=1 Tax=Porcisia hertigi TaxID=2761500 RepID=A0A836LEX8_9TRYP|nr:hypothetical protein JKF63_05111 [Porcisia hertigi]
MSHGTPCRAKSPSHQQLYKAHSETLSRGPTSTIPTPNSFALSRVSSARSPRNSNQLMLNSAASTRSKSSRLEDQVYVADVNPTYSITAAVRCIAPVNDRIMWTAEYSGTLCIRALPKGTPLKELPGREDSYCVSLMYLPKENVVWAGFQDGYLHVYSAKNMDLLTEVMAHAGGLHCMVEVEGFVFTGGANWKVCRWDPAKGNALLQRALHGHSGGVRCLVVYEGPTGAVLFSGSDDGTVRAWDPYDSLPDQDNPDANIHVFTGHNRSVLALAVVPHANQLWSAGEDFTVRVWDMRSLSCLAVLRGGHTAPIANLMVVESRVWSADKHGHILIWDITTRSLLQDLAKRVPYWGTRQGMILAMQKVQPITAYKVWTASSNGVMQCWNAETVPIVFDDVPISAGVLIDKNVGSMPTPVISSRKNNGAAAATMPGSESEGAVRSSALTVASPNNSRLINHHHHSGVNSSTGGGAPMAQMQQYIRSLQEELEGTKRDARLNYEKYRLEVQREIETQQLLAEENDRLRSRVSELSKCIGEAEESLSLPTQGSRSEASHHLANDDVKRLQSVLIDTQRQLEKAVERQRELEAELDQYKSASPSLRMSIVTTPSASAMRDPCRQTPRHDDAAKQPDADASNHSHIRTVSGSTAFGEAGYPTDPFNALLPILIHEGGSATHAGTPVTRTRLSRRFNGGNWQYIMEEKPHELHSTFVADCCAGLGVAPTQLQRVDLRLGSLAAEVEVVHPASVPAAELERRMRAYRFPALMQLHTSAFTAAKTAPDTAAATARDLQRKLDELQRERSAEPSPEPQHPTSVKSHHNEGGMSDAERQRLRDQSGTLRDTIQHQIKLINELKEDAKEREAKLSDALKRLGETEDKLHEAVKQGPCSAPGVPQRLTRQSTGSNTEYDNREPPTLTSTASNEQTTELAAVLLGKDVAASDAEEYVALNDYLHDQLKPMISQLKRARGELQLDNEHLKKQVEELTAKLQSQELNGRQAAGTQAPAHENSDLEQLREEYVALNDYLHDQLKPMISQLKRARGELQLDNEHLKKQVEELTAKLQSQELNGRQAAGTQAPTHESSDLEQLREEYVALNDYLHDQLKPMISQLKRTKGEAQIDLLRIQEDLKRAYEMCEKTTAALEEEHVREEKMGEAMEALRKALEAEQAKNQATGENAAGSSARGENRDTRFSALQDSEAHSGSPRESTELHRSGDHAICTPVSSNRVAEDPLDKLVALNMELSVRLADAEMVIGHLQDSLNRSASHLAAQRDEAQSLLKKIEQYQQSGSGSQGPVIVSQSASDSDIGISASLSKSPSHNRE